MNMIKKIYPPYSDSHYAIPYTQADKTNKIIDFQGIKDEVLQPSALHNFTWPPNDPLRIMQESREHEEQDIALITNCARTVNLDLKEFEKNTRSFEMVEKLLYLLTMQQFQFNPTSKVRAEKWLLTSIKSAVASNKPITVVYPLMCCIGNWAKQMTNLGPYSGPRNPDNSLS